MSSSSSSSSSSPSSSSRPAAATSGKPRGSAFPRSKLSDGTPNPKYVDVLDEDKPVAGQKFACLSFISPESILKKKDLFFFREFLNSWEHNTAVELLVKFTNFAAFKYGLSQDDLTEDMKAFVAEEKAALSESAVLDQFKTFLEHREEDLTDVFNVENKFQTSVRGVKVRGVYPTQEEAEMRCKLLRESDPNHDIFVGPVGLWMPWEPEAFKTSRVEYMENELNQLMHEKIKNEAKAKTAFDARIKETRHKAMDDNMAKAERSGNLLSQTLDAQGNLVSVRDGGGDGGAASTVEASLGAFGPAVTAEQIRTELFCGENIVIDTGSRTTTATAPAATTDAAAADAATDDSDATTESM